MFILSALGVAAFCVYLIQAWVAAGDDVRAAERRAREEQQLRDFHNGVPDPAYEWVRNSK